MGSCSNRQYKDVEGCNIIQECIEQRLNNQNSNSRINELIPILEEQTGIESSCDKGTLGYMYMMVTDSIYYSDLLKWGLVLKCDEQLTDSIKGYINEYNRKSY